MKLDSLLYLHVLFLEKKTKIKNVNLKRNKAETVKWVKCGILDACAIVSSQSVPSECSNRYGEFMRTVSAIWMPILLFCSDLPHPFFLHIFYLVGFLSPVVLGCVRWVISSKVEGRNCKKCEQDGREGRANTCEAGRSSCDWLENEWTFEREVIRKVEPNSVHSRRTRVSGYRLEQGSFWLDVKGEKPAGSVFEVLKQA